MTIFGKISIVLMWLFIEFVLLPSVYDALLFMTDVAYDHAHWAVDYAWSAKIWYLQNWIHLKDLSIVFACLIYLAYRVLLAYLLRRIN